MTTWLAELEAGLHDVRRRSEELWAKAPEFVFDPDADVGGHPVAPGTRWGPSLDASGIRDAEALLGFAAPPDYRAYLSILNGTRPERRGASFDDHGLRPSTRPGFLGLTRDAAAMHEAREQVVEGFAFDADHGLWPDSWGERPEAPWARERRVRELIGGAAPLIPLFEHRHLLVTSRDRPNAVLSIHQTDIVIYGRNLVEYLSNELFVDPISGRTLGAATSYPLLAEASSRSFGDGAFWSDLIGRG